MLMCDAESIGGGITVTVEERVFAKLGAGCCSF